MARDWTLASEESYHHCRKTKDQVHHQQIATIDADFTFVHRFKTFVIGRIASISCDYFVLYQTGKTVNTEQIDFPRPQRPISAVQPCQSGRA